VGCSRRCRSQLRVRRRRAFRRLRTGRFQRLRCRRAFRPLRRLRQDRFQHPRCRRALQSRRGRLSLALARLRSVLAPRSQRPIGSACPPKRRSRPPLRPTSRPYLIGPRRRSPQGQGPRRPHPQPPARRPRHRALPPRRVPGLQPRSRPTLLRRSWTSPTLRSNTRTAPLRAAAWLSASLRIVPGGGRWQSSSGRKVAQPRAAGSDIAAQRASRARARAARSRPCS